MKELLDRINVFELKVQKAVEMIDQLKKENEILFKENFRLKEEINQLSNKVNKEPDDMIGLKIDKKNQLNSKINIEWFRKELDNCMIELDACIKMAGN